MAQVGRRSNADRDILMTRIKNMHLSGVSIEEIAGVVQLRPDTVRKHLAAIRKQWVEEGIGAAETKVELLERANHIAKMASTGHTNAKGKSYNGEAAFLKLQLEVIDRIAKLTGAYEAQKTELTGPNGGPIQLQVSEHPIDNLDPADLAGRMRNWAEALEEAVVEQPDVSSVVEGSSKNV